jgi:hypothetical protein
MNLRLVTAHSANLPQSVLGVERVAQPTCSDDVLKATRCDGQLLRIGD